MNLGSAIMIGTVIFFIAYMQAKSNKGYNIGDSEEFFQMLIVFDKAEKKSLKNQSLNKGLKSKKPTRESLKISKNNISKSNISSDYFKNPKTPKKGYNGQIPILENKQACNNPSARDLLTNTDKHESVKPKPKNTVEFEINNNIGFFESQDLN